MAKAACARPSGPTSPARPCSTAHPPYETRAGPEDGRVGFVHRQPRLLAVGRLSHGGPRRRGSARDEQRRWPRAPDEVPGQDDACVGRRQAARPPQRHGPRPWQGFRDRGCRPPPHLETARARGRGPGRSFCASSAIFSVTSWSAPQGACACTGRVRPWTARRGMPHAAAVAKENASRSSHEPCSFSARRSRGVARAPPAGAVRGDES